jgi:small subunit ribosomal protein S20
MAGISRERKGDSVANTRSARKRIKQNEKRRLRNRAIRSQVRSAVKDAREAETGKGAEAREAIREAIRTIDKAVSRGILHRNTAARKKSALARRLQLVK